MPQRPQYNRHCLHRGTLVRQELLYAENWCKRRKLGSGYLRDCSTNLRLRHVRLLRLSDHKDRKARAVPKTQQEDAVSTHFDPGPHVCVCKHVSDLRHHLVDEIRG